MNTQHKSADDVVDNDTKALPGFSPDAVNFMRFFTIAGIAGVFLAGYSYANEYFDYFGLSLHEVDIGYLETIEFVTYLLQDYGVVLGGIGIVTLFSLAISWARYGFGNFGFYVSIAVLFLVVSSLAVYSGTLKAKDDAEKFVKGTHGRVAYCQLKSSADFSADFRHSFERVTREHRVIKVIETSTTIYLFVVPTNLNEENYHGDSIGIQKGDISHCRVAGSSD